MDECARVVDPVSQVELHVPAHATPERAIRRQALRRSGELRTIQFFPDFSHSIGLWESGSENYVLDPEDLQLSEELTADLHRWATVWDTVFGPEQEWPAGSEAVAERWGKDGDELAERIAAEIWDFAEVVATHRGY